MSCRLLQSRRFVTSSQSSATAQKSKGPWPPEEEAQMESSRWSARRHMTQCYCSALLPLGTPSAGRAAGERRGLGWGRRCIPEYMTRCSRSDRSQPWLMKPKRLHRCSSTLGSTSSHQQGPNPPLFVSPNPQTGVGAVRDADQRRSPQVLFFSDLTGGISQDLRLKASFQRPWTWARLVPSTYQQSLHYNKRHAI